MEYKIISNYQSDKKLRESFNNLSKKVFGLDFEPWYQNGFWKDNYIPYSVVIDDQVVSNISVNICNFVFDGKEVHLIQLGTIMTDPEYRGKGFSKLLMNCIHKEYENKVDGIYLFGNDSVKDFYPLFGFKTQKEFQYSKIVVVKNDRTIVSVPMNNKIDWIKMVEVIKHKKQMSRFYMSENIDLYMFYLSQFMNNNVFYIKEDDAYVVAEVDGGTLTLHAIFGDANIDKVIESFGNAICKVVLCFTPLVKDGYKIEELHEEDTTLFVKGKFFENFEKEQLMFPSITHA